MEKVSDKTNDKTTDKTTDKIPSDKIPKNVDNRYILYVSTLHTSQFRTIFESLKDPLRDANLKFVMPGNKDGTQDGLSLFATNNQINSLAIKMNLPATSFHIFYLAEEKVTIGVSMPNLYKLLKLINGDDSLTLFIEKDDKNNLGIKIENKSKQFTMINKLKLLDVDEENGEIDIKTDNIVSIFSSEFHRLIKDMSNAAELADIKLINIENKYNLIICCNGELATQEAKYSTAGNGTSCIKVNILNKKKESIISGTYDLKNLSLFSKCTNICQTIDIYMMNNYPLTLKYQIGDLGNIFLFLTSVDKCNTSDDENKYYVSDNDA